MVAIVTVVIIVVTSATKYRMIYMYNLGIHGNYSWRAGLVLKRLTLVAGMAIRWAAGTVQILVGRKVCKWHSMQLMLAAFAPTHSDDSQMRTSLTDINCKYMIENVP